MKSEGDALVWGRALQPQRCLAAVQRSGLQKPPEPAPALKPAPWGIPQPGATLEHPGGLAGCVQPTRCQLAKPAPVPRTQILVLHLLSPGSPRCQAGVGEGFTHVSGCRSSQGSERRDRQRPRAGGTAPGALYPSPNQQRRVLLEFPSWFKTSTGNAGTAHALFCARANRSQQTTRAVSPPAPTDGSEAAGRPRGTVPLPGDEPVPPAAAPVPGPRASLCLFCKGGRLPYRQKRNAKDEGTGRSPARPRRFVRLTLVGQGRGRPGS